MDAPAVCAAEPSTGPNPKHLLRYASIVFGVPGACAQVVYGMREMKTATEPQQKINGGIDIAMGVARGTASATTIIAGMAAATHLASVGHAVAAYFWCQSASILVDGGRDLYNGFRTGSGRDIRSGCVKLSSIGVMVAGMAVHSPAIVLAGSCINDATVLVQNRGEIANAIKTGYQAAKRKLLQLSSP